jgi:hypothetical protein
VFPKRKSTFIVVLALLVIVGVLGLGEYLAVAGDVLIWLLVALLLVALIRLIGDELRDAGGKGSAAAPRKPTARFRFAPFGICRRPGASPCTRLAKRSLPQGIAVGFVAQPQLGYDSPF